MCLVMHDPTDQIRHYLLAPDHRGSHLRQLAEHMAQTEPAPGNAGAATARNETIRAWATN